MSSEPQQTLARTASVSGTSLHTGEKVTLKLQPAPVDFGLKFRRKDLQDEPTIDATIANLKTVERATTIGEGSIRVHTVEHVLSSLSAMGVDNAIVEMDANEPPIGDGSARPYVELIKKAGIVAQETPRRIFDVREPIYVETKNGSLMVLLPDPEGPTRKTNSPLLISQSASRRATTSPLKTLETFSSLIIPWRSPGSRASAGP